MMSVKPNCGGQLNRKGSLPTNLRHHLPATSDVPVGNNPNAPVGGTALLACPFAILAATRTTSQRWSREQVYPIGSGGRYQTLLATNDRDGGASEVVTTNHTNRTNQGIAFVSFVLFVVPSRRSSRRENGLARSVHASQARHRSVRSDAAGGSMPWVETHGYHRVVATPLQAPACYATSPAA